MKKALGFLSRSALLALITFTSALAQQPSVSGFVKTNNGIPLKGISVLVKDQKTGTATDSLGFFELPLPSAITNPVLVFSSVGFESQEVPVNHETTLTVTLKEASGNLSDVVVIGYGSISKHDLTTAVSKVDAKTISSIPIYTPDQLLQGTVPGVTAIQNSGSPGSPLTVRVRGTGTAGFAQPLYIVDGLQVPDLDYLNSTDIEDIFVLKDAASAAIYGARGGNGVVLVRTKTGNRKINKPVLSLNGYYGIQNLGHKPDLMNRDQYVNYYNQYQNDHGGTPLSESDRQKLPNTDWYDQVFKKNVPTYNANISLSNGGEKYSYYVSGGYFNQDGLVGGKEGKSTYTRKNLKFNFETEVVKNFKIQVGGDLVGSERNYLFENQAGTGTALLNYLDALPPIYPAFDSADHTIPFNMGNTTAPVYVNGVLLPAVGAVTNPFIALQLTNNRLNSNISVYNISGNWHPVQNLELVVSYASYNNTSVNKTFYPVYDYRPQQNFFNQFNSFTQTDFVTKYDQWEGNAKYRFKNLKDQGLEILGGFSVLQTKGSSSSQTGSDFFVNSFDQVNFALIKDPSKIINAVPSAYETGLLSFYGRLNYNYREKYLFSATVRSDASSLFGKDYRTAVFPSFSAGWVISEENILKNASMVNLLKLRASWGINGNNFIAPYQYSTIVDPNSGPSFGGLNTPGISIPYLANPAVKWEQVTQTDIGVDINLFNNSLGFTFDYYIKKNSDVLVPIGTPAYTGYSSAAANVADVKNSGVEFAIIYKKNYRSGFSWNTSFNIGFNTNEVTGLGLNGQPINGGNIGFIFPDPITRTNIGHPIASFYGYKVDHLDQAGNFVFKDLDGVAGPDKTYLGSPFASSTYGFTLGFAYKGFDLSGFLYGSQGNKIYDATVRLDATYSNRPVSYGQPGAPRNILGSGGTGDLQTDVSDFYVHDGSFAKLKTLTFGYSISKSAIKSIGLSNLRVYVTSQNLFVITSYKGIDPEIGQSSSQNPLDVGINRGFYPQPKTFLFGIQATF